MSRRHDRIGDEAVIGRGIGIVAQRDRQSLRKRTAGCNREQMHVAVGVHVALRAEQHAAVGVEAFDDVVAAMPGHALRAPPATGMT